jgi:hypothetical protein
LSRVPWRRIVRLVSLVCLVAIAAYAVCGTVIVVVFDSYLERDWLMWPDFLPQWPLLALGALFVALNVVDVVVQVVRGRLSGRRCRRPLSQATAWLQGPDADEARRSGDPHAALHHVRTHAHNGCVELLWDSPSGDAEVVVHRSRVGYGAAVDDAGDQEEVFRGRGFRFADWDVAGGHVYFYTLFAAGREGGWSTPSWVYAVTPVVPLGGLLRGRLAEMGAKLTLGGGDLQKYRRQSRR